MFKRKKYTIAALIIFLLLGLCTGCGKANDEASKEEASIDVFAMDTYMTFTAYGEHAEEALQEAEEEILRLDELWSVGKENSEISRLNKEGSGTVSAETIQLLTCAKEISEETKGAFDLTIYPLMELWGFTTQEYQVPEETKIRDIVENHMGMEHVKIDPETQTVTLEQQVKIDLGGIAKGYASQQVEKIFQKHGVESGIVSLGGNIQAIGKKTDGNPWKVGIQPPTENMEMAGSYEAEGEAVITSGGYERYFEEDGTTYHHILDPHTGYSTKQDLLSVTIISKDGMKADCLSTTLFVLGKEKAVDYWRNHKEEFDMILIDEEENIFISEGIQGKFQSEYPFEIIDERG